MSLKPEKRWTPLTTEVCTWITKSGRNRSSSAIRLFSPSFMKTIPKGVAKQTNISINTSSFKNDTSCKPRLSSVVVTQNYITASGPYDRNWSGDYIDYGASIQVDYSGKDMAVVTAKASQIDPTYNINND